LAAVLVAFAIATAVLHLLGVGGYRLGWLWCAAVLVIGLGALMWHTQGSSGQRGIWLAVVLVVGATATGWLVDHAPLSRTRVAELGRKVRVDFSDAVSERISGHSWCRPHCPRVVRTVRAPRTDPRATMANIAAQMRLAGLLDDLREVAAPRPQQFLRVYSERAVAEVRITTRPDYLLVTLTVTATRGRVRHPRDPQLARAMSAVTW
jgi:hypothetical protein